MPEMLKIRGARVHNLKNVSINIPKNKLVVITGLSGSGKSSLAFDTIYAEGQRRYAESLSAYARQFMEVRDKPDIDGVEGLSPTIAIDQRINTQNPRSTVGTVTEVYDFLRLLFARAGKQYCPDCEEEVTAYTFGEIVEQVRDLGRKNREILILSPLVRNEPVEQQRALLEKVEQSGFDHVRVNGKLMKINELATLAFDPKKNYQVELLIGKISDIKKQDPTKWTEIALDLSNGLVFIGTDKEDKVFSTSGLCLKCGRIMPDLDIRNFSFNSPFGACPRCTGLGITMEVDPDLVIPNPRLSLLEGAVQPWTRITGNQTYYQKILKAVADKHGFSLELPVAKLPEKVMNIILKGTGKEVYEIDGKKTIYPGVIEDLRQRHLQTDSEYVRKEIEQYMKEQVCSLCEGKKLKKESLSVKFEGYNIADLAEMNIDENIIFFKNLLKKNGLAKKTIVEPVVKEILIRLENLSRVGLDYLNLTRSMNTVSGGEATRVRLATQLSSGLTGVIYVLDEPSVGLHSKDNQKLIDTLKYLRDLGNTVIVVEHDAAIMKEADYLIDVGPERGFMGVKSWLPALWQKSKKLKIL